MIRKLNWLCHSPSPYNDFLFEHLARHLGLDFEVHYMYTDGTEHRALLDAPRAYRWRRMTSTLADMALVRAALDPAQAFVVAGWDRLSFVLMLALAPNRCLIWSDTPREDKPRSPLKAALRQAVLRFVFGRARAVMGTGAPALVVLGRLGAPAPKLINFPCWVPVPEAPPAPPSAGARPFTLLAVGRLVELKRFEHLVALATRLRERGEAAFEIRIVGDGPERTRLESAITEAGLEAHVRLVGWKSGAALAEELAGCDVLVHPTSRDAYGVVVAEAMAAGKPVIATRQTMAALDRIVEGENGYTYDVGDLEALTLAVSRVMGDADLRARLSENAFRTASAWRVERAVDILSSALA